MHSLSPTLLAQLKYDIGEVDGVILGARGAYGLMAREVIGLLKHLQHAPGKTVIFDPLTDTCTVTTP